ncbi:helix-turn-helix transcriptional regulator [Streptomyces sp. G-G2]|uniref:helix-turn-helix transcriptional regulator n=1 Tax=Streptomyces sp. G-G2 TaxID=3046201 RepID=UPI0024BB34EE|nr:helix-turn-helix transcriptional regulator [Streptomyces sp. G-G2]MDJ0382451.1 helix-turn-helix transcriptional regulator [Streptomyces sp. G-G2]
MPTPGGTDDSSQSTHHLAPQSTTEIPLPPAPPISPTRGQCFRPDSALRDVVHFYAGYEYGRIKPRRRMVCPNTMATISFGFGAPIRTDSMVDPGRSLSCRSRADLPPTTASMGEHQGNVRGMTLLMTPMGAYQLFGVPMSEWNQPYLDPAHLLPRPLRHLPEQLEAATAHEQRRTLDRALRPLLRQGPHIAPEIVWAWHELHRTHGRIRVKDLSRGTHWSVRQLERRFLQHVGRSPAAIARILRFARALRLQDRGLPLARVAQLAGFHDQAHYNHVFKATTGLTPTQLPADRINWTPARAA